MAWGASAVSAAMIEWTDVSDGPPSRSAKPIRSKRFSRVICSTVRRLSDGSGTGTERFVRRTQPTWDMSKQIR